VTMRNSRIMALGVLMGSAQVAAVAQVPTLPYSATTRPILAVSKNWMPLAAAAIVGLDSLGSKSLPRGYRELRFELGCDLCTPFHLIRLVETPGKKVLGDAYIFWSSLEQPTPSDTVQERINGAYAELVRGDEASLGCKAIKSTASPEYLYCRLPPQQGWTTLFRALDSLGVLAVGSDSGYAPNPPPPPTGPGSSADTTKGPRWTGYGCNDIAGVSVTIEVLDAARYRNAFFWCLEREGVKPGSEHWRMVQARLRAGQVFSWRR